MESNGYATLEKIMTGNVVDLYSMECLPHLYDRLKKEGKKFENEKSIIEFVIKMNRYGLAPTVKDLSHFYKKGSMRRLVEMDVLLPPTIMEYGSISERIYGRGRRVSKLENIPKNIACLLSTSRGAGYSYSKRFSEGHMNSRKYKICYLAMLFDENGPVFKKCFPKSEINYVERTISSLQQPAQPPVLTQAPCMAKR